MSATFRTKNRVETFTRKIELAIPPEKPVITGYITVDYKIRSKEAFNELLDKGLPDEEFIREIVDAVHGLGHPETDEELTGQAAIDEVLTGHYSMYLVPAITSTYVEQFGEARRGNSKRRR